MNAATPSPTSVSPVHRRRRWPWVVGLCLAPFVILGVAVLSCLTLDREAAALRRHVMNATGSPWKTKVQFSVGGLTLSLVRAGLSVVENADAVKARMGLRAVSRASVGVYERATSGGQIALENLMDATDRVMRQRGWTRIIGVSHEHEVVLAYVPTAADDADPLVFCLAVIKDHEFVVVSTRLDADAVTELVQQNLPAGFSETLHRKLRLASL